MLRNDNFFNILKAQSNNDALGMVNQEGKVRKESDQDVMMPSGASGKKAKKRNKKKKKKMVATVGGQEENGDERLDGASVNGSVKVPQNVHDSPASQPQKEPSTPTSTATMPLRKDFFWPDMIPSPSSSLRTSKQSEMSQLSHNEPRGKQVIIDDDSHLDAASTTHSEESSTPIVTNSTSSPNDSPQKLVKKKKRNKRKKANHRRINSLLDENSIFSPPMRMDDSASSQNPFIEWKSRSKKRKMKMLQRQLETQPQDRQHNGGHVHSKHTKKEPQESSTPLTSSTSSLPLTPSSPGILPFQEIETVKQLKQTIEHVAKSESEYRTLQWKEWINNLRDPDLSYLNEQQQVVSFRDAFLESKTLEYIIQSILKEPVDQEEETILWELFTQTLMSASESFYTNLIESLHQIHLRIRDEPLEVKSMLMELISHDIIATVKQNPTHHSRVRSNLDNWNVQIAETRGKLYRKKNEESASIDSTTHSSAAGGASTSMDTLHIYANLVNLFEKKCVTLLKSIQHTPTPTSPVDVTPFGPPSGAKEKLDNILKAPLESNNKKYPTATLNDITKQKKKTMNQLNASIAKCDKTLTRHSETFNSLTQQKASIEAEILRLQTQLEHVNSQLDETRLHIQQTETKMDGLTTERHQMSKQFAEQMDTLYANSIIEQERNSTKRVVLDLIGQVETTILGAYESRKVLFEKKMVISVQQYWNNVEEYAEMLARSVMQLAQEIVQLYGDLSLRHKEYESAEPHSKTRKRIQRQHKVYERKLGQWNNLLSDTRRLRKSITRMQNHFSLQQQHKLTPSLSKIQSYMNRVKQTEALKKNLVVEFDWVEDNKMGDH
uniref:Uncharacterized protein n=1 Tax=Percolomonas cosmopolitus TaxID=63605 RepID=A0A7S1KT34_9EUKA|mmetsp:Transcript_8380/g.31013  ORF Transcript_8380/g.31013 Transcript_8380/m.31013 type:complete len:835 (+) Transcript_8380:267-2771(+)|eukprot:CAMPEP_0117447420 /NCGR_PEP_ID=MMETSP0759-20121206/6866_1 /TAXON_ID=63605 /ORGANISM="Percolomonas cosmopolitus, Strain WS" /LENGTH=834 /DNA_ID=CAMNT_0005239755 /DNA_START=217 /DNA_END=2721 /DNA_ORIENTATION=-